MLKRVQHDSKTHDVTLNLFQGLSNFKTTQKNKQVAFTLAEVLITLVVIGIIAAITVPVMHANYKKQATSAKLKKAYSNLSNVIRLSELENGPMKNWEWPATSADTEPFVKKYFTNYIRIAKYDLKKTTNNQYWWIKNLQGGKTASGIAGSGWHTLADGTSFNFFSNPGKRYVWMFIDLNASGEPNTLGKDIFMFDIYNGKLKFWGQGNTNFTCNDEYCCKKTATGSYTGGYCGAWIFKNGFEIPDGYPL